MGPKFKSQVTESLQVGFRMMVFLVRQPRHLAEKLDSGRKILEDPILPKSLSSVQQLPSIKFCGLRSGHLQRGALEVARGVALLSR